LLPSGRGEALDVLFFGVLATMVSFENEVTRDYAAPTNSRTLRRIRETEAGEEIMRTIIHNSIKLAFEDRGSTSAANKARATH
jgi:hypothetical protein